MSFKRKLYALSAVLSVINAITAATKYWCLGKEESLEEVDAEA